VCGKIVDRMLAASLLAISTGLLGCGAVPSGKVASPSLVGTTWELVAIQSMDDAQGRTGIPSPDHFTVTLEEGGRASFRLDCNRGSAGWESTPSADGATGGLRFGAIATTRAMCPPPHLDVRIVRDLEFVRSYLLEDGKLFMSLMADGGIYEWRPRGK
jgi:heat shock protein HslJ